MCQEGENSGVHSHKRKEVEIMMHIPKLDFRRFDGENLNGWIHKAERYLDYEGTPYGLKVKIAYGYLVGEALE